MTPIEKAAAVYESEPCARPFREDLEAHLLHGLVFNTRESFIMARYVSKDWSPQDIVNPWINHKDGSQLNCIHIYLASGDITEFFTFPHQSVKWVSFERNNRLKFYHYLPLKSRCTKNFLVPTGLLT